MQGFKKFEIKKPEDDKPKFSFDGFKKGSPSKQFTGFQAPAANTFTVAPVDKKPDSKIPEFKPITLNFGKP